MDQYNKLSYRFARQLTLDYSSSFGLASRLFDTKIRPHIFAVYGLVRIADEIVDTYQGTQAGEILDELEQDTYRAIRTGYSANLIVQAFALTARKYDIDPTVIKAFFKSMRLDLTDQTYTAALYKEYIYGSAEAVGLMCLSVFCEGDSARYKQLRPGAEALGAAYQKVNFLRDISSDFMERQRFYFPGHTYHDFNEQAKRAVIHDITDDFNTAAKAINQLPDNSRRAVLASYEIYRALLGKLHNTSIKEIKQGRVRISAPHKLWLALKSSLKGRAS